MRTRKLVIIHKARTLMFFYRPIFRSHCMEQLMPTQSLLIFASCLNSLAYLLEAEAQHLEEILQASPGKRRLFQQRLSQHSEFATAAVQTQRRLKKTPKNRTYSVVQTSEKHLPIAGQLHRFVHWWSANMQRQTKTSEVLCERKQTVTSSRQRVLRM